MADSLRNNNKGQTTIEITLAIIIGVLLITGVISVWNYYGKVKVERMDIYRATRYNATMPHGRNTGQQLAYRQPRINIFSMVNTVGSAPPASGPETDPANPCFVASEASMQLSQTLTNEANARAREMELDLNTSQQLKRRFAELKIWTLDRGSDPDWDESPEVVSSWMYDDPADLIETYNWAEVSGDFDRRISETLVRNSAILFFNPDDSPRCNPRRGINQWCFTPQYVKGNYITRGIDLEIQTEADANAVVMKQRLSELVEEAGNARLYACMREFEAGGVPPSCDVMHDGTLVQAETKIKDSIIAVNNSNFVQAKIDWQLAGNLLYQYRDDYFNCASQALPTLEPHELPWYVERCFFACRDELMARKEKLKEAYLARGRGKLAESTQRQEEADLLQIILQDCLVTCSGEPTRENRDPCMSTCGPLYDAWQAKVAEVQKALDEGRIADAQALSSEASALQDAFNNCYQPCVDSMTP